LSSNEPETITQLFSTQLNVLICGPWISVTSVDCDLLSIEFASAKVCQAEMTKSVRFEKRQAGPARNSLDDLVPHVTAERLATVTVRVGNEQCPGVGPELSREQVLAKAHKLTE